MGAHVGNVDHSSLTSKVKRGQTETRHNKIKTPNHMETRTHTATPVALDRLVSRLRMHVRDMDARITMAQVEIREKQAAVGQLEKEKWALDREVDKIEELLSANANVDLPDTAAQDSASKSNSPAVSG